MNEKQLEPGEEPKILIATIDAGLNNPDILWMKLRGCRDKLIDYHNEIVAKTKRIRELEQLVDQLREDDD